MYSCLEAKQDLDKAIELSAGKGRAACQAFAQRGLIHRVEGNMDAAKVLLTLFLITLCV
jgi:hypothetical protein